MELIEALAQPTEVDVLRRLNSAAPASASFLTVTMPPWKTYRDRSVIGNLQSLGWRVVGQHERTVFLQRQPDDVPEAARGAEAIRARLKA